MKIGDNITIVVDTPWSTVEESGIISDIKENLIFIKDLDIPFNAKTGYKTQCFTGSNCYIKEITKRNK